MKRGSTIFLQVVIVLIGMSVLAALLWEPQLEGVNAHATQFEIYFKDPFLAYVYLGSIPFFVGLWNAYKVLGYIRQNKAFSEAAVKTLQTIKNCALITAGAIVAADIFLRIAAQSSNDDPAGAIALGIIATFASIVVGVAAGVLGRILQNGMDIKSENEKILN